jgi:hypothetical protein
MQRQILNAWDVTEKCTESMLKNRLEEQNVCFFHLQTMREDNRNKVSFIFKGGERCSVKLYPGYNAIHNSQVR